MQSDCPWCAAALPEAPIDGAPSQRCDECQSCWDLASEEGLAVAA